MLHRVFQEGDVAHFRRPAPPHRREHHHHRAQPEARHGQHQDREGTRHIVRRGVLADCRQHADRQRHRQRHGQGQHAQREGRGDARHHHPQHRLALPQRLAQVAMQHDIADPVQVLLPHRAVEAERADQVIAGARIGADVVLAQHQVDHVARHQPRDDEHDDAGEDQRRQQRQQAAQEIGAHGRPPCVGPDCGVAPVVAFGNTGAQGLADMLPPCWRSGRCGLMAPQPGRPLPPRCCVMSCRPLRMGPPDSAAQPLSSRAAWPSGRAASSRRPAIPARCGRAS
ncbi:hypothetical protein D3C81_948150 [compost metagenome]